MHKILYNIIQGSIDDAALNYCAYGDDTNPIVVMAINKNEVARFKALIDNEYLTDVTFAESTKIYYPPAVNTFGTIAFNNISNRSYLSGNTDLMLAVANELHKNGILFSGRVYKNYTSITVNEKDRGSLIYIKNAITKKREKTQSVLNSKNKTLLNATVVGEFLEFYGNDAEIVANALELNLTTKDKQSMVGVVNNNAMLNTLGSAGFEILINNTPRNILSQQFADLEEKFNDNMPDNSITLKDMRDYGYEYTGMLPLNQEKALELFNSDLTSVYMLFKDGSEAKATNTDDILNHHGIYGVEVDEWSKALDDRTLNSEVAEVSKIDKSYNLDEVKKENLQSDISVEPEIEKAHGSFRIMQLFDEVDNKYHGIRFMSKDFNDTHGVQLNHSDYTQVYEGDLSEFSANHVLESIYERMNIGEKPDGYTGHSLSVSDVIITNIDGEEKAYYCDDIGFSEMPEYFLEKTKLQNEITDSSSMPDDSIEESNSNSENIQLTELEQAFLTGEIEKSMAKSILAWDEIEDLGYIFFQEGYIAQYPAHDKALYGNGATEQRIYEIAQKMRNGEDIRADLTRALLDNQRIFKTRHDNIFEVAYNKEDITATFGKVSRSVKYEDIGDAFLTLFENEYKEIVAEREAENLAEQSLIDELMVGTGFQDGKFRLQEYYKKNSPSNQEFAKIVSKEYGIGGHTGRGNVKSFDCDSNGIKLKLINGAEYKFTWLNIAQKLSELIDTDTYITDKDIENTVRNAKFVIANPQSYGNSEVAKAEETLSKYDNVIEMHESTVVKDFKAKTEEMFHNINGYRPENIENAVKDFTIATFYNNSITAEIGNVAVTGSRSRGLENENSDIDVVIEVNSDLKEDALFNILNEDGMEIDGIKVDINPIRAEETGTLETYLSGVEAYLTEKAEQTNAESEKETSGKQYDVFIYDGESKTIQPMRCQANNEREAREQGNSYIHQWHLVDAEITDIKEVQPEREISAAEVFNKALELIDDYSQRTFGEEAFDYNTPPFDLSNINLANTTDEDTGLLIQVFADLENNQMVYFYDGDIARIEQYQSLADMNTEVLVAMNFNDLVALYDDEKIKCLQNKKETLLSERNSLTQRYEDDNATILEKTEVLNDIESINKRLSEIDKNLKLLYKSDGIVVDEEINYPTITCQWSENLAFEDGKTYSVYEFENLMKKLDDERIAGKEAAIEKYGSEEAWYAADIEDEFTRFYGYDKTKFTINMPDGTQYTERQDIGDGEGGVISFLSQYDNYKDIVPLLEQAYEEQAKNYPVEETIVEQNNDVTDFVITDDSLGDGGAKTKFMYNIAAIETLKLLERENRAATDEEKEILSRYVGWGGIPHTVNVIDDCAFEGCDALINVFYQLGEGDWKNITIGENNDRLSNIKYYEYSYSDNKYYTSGDYIYTILYDGTAEIVSYLGNESTVVIPSELDGLIVTSIGYMLTGEESLPGSVPPEEIRGAFQSNNAKRIIMPDTITRLGSYTFAFCNNLTDLQLSKNLKIIECDGIFACYGLTNLTLPEGLVTLEYTAIHSCDNIKTLTIPKSVRRINECALGYRGSWLMDKIQDFKIKCYSGTAGEQYAIDNEIPYELLDEPATAELKYQLMDMGDGTSGVRFVLVADEEAVKAVDSASVYVSVPDDGDTAPLTIRKAYKSLIAGGKRVSAGEGKVFLIGKFVGIPDDMLNGITAHFTLGENTYDRTI